MYKVVVIFCMLLGLSCGLLISELIDASRQFSKSKITKFRDGKLNFCQINELERFLVCPRNRYHEELKTGGFVTNYFCGGTTAYTEMTGLSPLSKKVIKGKIDAYRSVATITEHCKTNASTVYKLEQK